MGEKNKFIRSWLMRVCRDTRTLEQVLDNVRAAKGRSRGLPESVYTEIEGYLELVVPQIRQLPQMRGAAQWIKGLHTQFNVMDVSRFSPEMQGLCIRSVVDVVNEHLNHTVVVIPEAWETLPEGRGSPVKLAAERLIRKGAALGNYLWIDSQDLGGVWKTVLRSCAVVLVGVQREANEIKRTLANIPGTLAKPKAADVATLELGQFYACWGRHVVKTYVQPAWMTPALAVKVAKGVMSAPLSRDIERLKEGHVTHEQAEQLKAENHELRNKIAALEEQLERNEERVSAHNRKHPQTDAVADATQRAPQLPARVPEALARRAAAGEGLAARLAPADLVELAQLMREEFRKDPALLKVAVSVPELQVSVTREVVEADGTSKVGMMALLIKDGFFDEGATASAAFKEMKRRGFVGAEMRAYEAAKELHRLGFLTRERSGSYVAVPSMKVNIKQTAA